MEGLGKNFQNLLLGREKQLNQPSSSSKPKREEVHGKLTKTKIIEQFGDDTTGNSQEKSSKASCKERGLVIPDDVIFEILSRLPAEFLWKVGRFVCKDWCKLIREPSFANSCVLLPSLLIQYIERPHSMRGRLNISSLSSPEFEVTKTDSRFPGIVRSTSDGVLLIEHKASLYVANPLTMQLVKTPSPTEEQDIKLNLEYSYIARVPDTGKFKVLCFSEKVSNGSKSTSCYMLTINNTMKWTKAFSIPPGWFEPMSSIREYSKSISGVVYIYSHESLLRRQILAIDVRTNELRTHILRIPIKDEHRLSNRIIFYGMNSLGFVETNRRDVSIWMLKDLYKSKWEFIKNIRVRNSVFDKRLSINDEFHLWLDSCGMLVTSRLCVKEPTMNVAISVSAYFTDGGEWRQVEKKPVLYTYEIFVHSNSLVRI